MGGRKWHLHYGDQISASQFGEEQARIQVEIDNLEADTRADTEDQLHTEDLSARFEELLMLLDRIDLATLWEAATDDERRPLLAELLASVVVHPVEGARIRLPVRR